MFCRVVGHDINAIDGPSWYTLPPGDRSVKLGPKNSMRTAISLRNEFGIPVAGIDANDYGCASDGIL